ncbi:hypothetical protein Tsubulata_005599 [Turnera subulata]|uniref:Uncharacterized protein n=1 Tax=Turnera subulata TaxID=218843 RepID=A0A9Q0GLG1_9ROSI|nr:hypothetical protein Tsubulata_005599 [Turnera subulata]
METPPPPSSGVFYLYLSRPFQRNALSSDFFTEAPHALSSLDQNPDASVIILSGSDDHFCAGIDVKDFSTLTSLSSSYPDTARASEYLHRHAKFLQDAVTAIERCCKPVIAVVRGACICRGRGYNHRL